MGPHQNLLVFLIPCLVVSGQPSRQSLIFSMFFYQKSKKADSFLKNQFWYTYTLLYIYIPIYIYLSKYVVNGKKKHFKQGRFCHLGRESETRYNIYIFWCGLVTLTPLALNVCRAGCQLRFGQMNFGCIELTHFYCYNMSCKLFI